jgi:hypothetical protein
MINISTILNNTGSVYLCSHQQLGYLCQVTRWHSQYVSAHPPSPETDRAQSETWFWDWKTTDYSNPWNALKQQVSKLSKHPRIKITHELWKCIHSVIVHQRNAMLRFQFKINANLEQPDLAFMDQHLNCNQQSPNNIIWSVRNQSSCKMYFSLEGFIHKMVNIKLESLSFQFTRTKSQIIKVYIRQKSCQWILL